jgi:hypothetical protein
MRKDLKSRQAKHLRKDNPTEINQIKEDRRDKKGHKGSLSSINFP